MAPTDPRDTELVAAIVAAVTGLIVAVHRDGDPERVIGQVGLLLTAIIEHKKAMAERPSDEALRRVVARLGR